MARPIVLADPIHVSAVIDRETYEALRSEAFAYHVSVSEVIRAALKAYQYDTPDQ